MKPLFAAIAIVGLIIPMPLLANDVSIEMGMIVPRICYIAPLGSFESGSDFIALTGVQEFCNGAGYQVVLDYTPGTMTGAVAHFGASTVTLDGSGEALLIDADYAVSRQSTLMIEGDHVVDQNSRLNLRMLPR